MTDYDEIVEKIKRLKNEEKFEEALQLCENLRKSQETSDQILELYIEVLFAYGHYLSEELIQEYEKAAEIYEKIHTLQPDNYKALYYRGVALFHSENYEEALKCFFKTIELKPDYEHAYYNIGLLHETRGDLDDALSFYNKTLKHDPLHLYASSGKAHVEETLRMMKLSRLDRPVDYKKLKSLLKASKRVEIRAIQNYLKIDEDDLDEIIAWCEKYDFQIDGKYLEINKSRLPDLLKKLDDKTV
ncbi:MAG: tetratricopeptide repeat protein [Candidatus Lokiarchaeota archaeon]|nr:tetratricopeptide repeat protein [Candidatus Lokiarchaeota archaeon]